MTKEELQIVNAGKASGKTPQEVASAIAKYRGGQSDTQQVVQPPASNQYSFGEAFGDVKEGISGAVSSMTTAGRGIVDRFTNAPAETKTQRASNVVGAGADFFRGIVGVVGNTFNAGMKLAVPQGVEDSVSRTVQTGVQKVAETDSAQFVYKQYQDMPFEKRMQVDNVLGYLEGIIAILAPGQAKTLAGYVVKHSAKLEPTVSNTTRIVSDFARYADKSGRRDMAVNIMQRVGRIDPSKEIEFQRMTGKTVGDFLVDRGEYAGQDKLIKNLFDESLRSYKQVDDQFEKIKGTYRPPVMDEMLDAMYARELRVSSKGAPSKNFAQVSSAYSKYKSGEGLTMKEINSLKRTYERTVRLGHAVDKNTELVEKATTLDDALREWQIGTAENSGFMNLREINKNTQATRFLADQLWRKNVKTSANNALSLTDAVLVAGGDWHNIGMVLTRRLVGNKVVQARIAKLFGVPKTVDTIVPKIRDPLLIESGVKGGPRTSIPSNGKYTAVPADKNIDVVTGTGVKRGDITPGQTMTEQQLSQSKSDLQSLPTTVPPPPPASTPLSTGVRGSVLDSKTVRSTSDFKTFERDTTLTGRDAQIQEASIEKYLLKKDALLKETLAKNGKIVNTDEQRKLYKDVGYNGTNAVAVQEASSALAKDQWRHLLKTNKQENVTIYAGGSGTGKTTAVKQLAPKLLNKSAAVLDGNLSTISSAEKRIAEAVNAGKWPRIIYLYRDPKGAWVDGVIKRMLSNPNEGGRIVPLSVFVDNHIGSYNVMKHLQSKGLRPLLIDNSLGKGNAKYMSMDKFRSVAYNKEKMISGLTTETKKLYESGKITKQQYDALIK